ncbi:DNA ligase [Paenibacillus darwinianus]|uniref:DNA ligase n=1 Tax=Paenibacillus darwinianus TaxID=1380763 RepID=A0A9W5S314_9BACL|nr:hypothetical protein [Paenibacillus darwinianus]EXX87956.1 DNA ligase [Paenibacillus darwinianus]EXX90469.1 DNA ligase [Paenibacillus darwinianus]EXX90495.1 DNA ligase [Paenibacillus darwinianus]
MGTSEGKVGMPVERLSVGNRVGALPLPAEPMAPVFDDRLPEGEDWVYQLKWDGVRILAALDGAGGAELYSKRMLVKNGTYPELAAMLSERSAELGPCVLDGELVYWDGVRPSFQKVLQRERMRGPGTSGRLEDSGLLYVLFDLLYDGSEDLRPMPYGERYARLRSKLPDPGPMLLVTDTFRDGAALWAWVEANGWEGVVSKRDRSPYREGKKHRDWLKKKTKLLLDVDIVGIKLREGRVASLVMAIKGEFAGSVSLGLDEPMRRVLIEQIARERNDADGDRNDSGSNQRGHSRRELAGPALEAGAAMPFRALPAELKNETVYWLQKPFGCRVTGLEMTAAGLLRHPKLAGFGRGTDKHGG